LIGIEKSVPSTSLSLSTTLTNHSVLFLQPRPICAPLIVGLVQETFQGAEPAVENEF
jgi:hypothetical protein